MGISNKDVIQFPGTFNKKSESGMDIKNTEVVQSTVSSLLEFSQNRNNSIELDIEEVGLDKSEEVYNEAIHLFQKKHPNIKINMDEFCLESMENNLMFHQICINNSIEIVCGNYDLEEYLDEEKEYFLEKEYSGTFYQNEIIKFLEKVFIDNNKSAIANFRLQSIALYPEQELGIEECVDDIIDYYLSEYKKRFSEKIVEEKEKEIIEAIGELYYISGITLYIALELGERYYLSMLPDDQIQLISDTIGGHQVMKELSCDAVGEEINDELIETWD